MTDEARNLRDEHGLFSTKVAVFALESLGRSGYSDSEHNPDRFPLRSVGFTSNHDTRSLAHAIDETRNQQEPWPFLHLVNHLGNNFPQANIHEGMSSAELAHFKIKRVIGSRALVAITAIWDILGLGAKHRYNVPGTTSETNWSWRMSMDELDGLSRQAAMLRDINTAANRGQNAVL